MKETQYTPGPWQTWQHPQGRALIEISTMRTPCPSVGQTPIATIDRRLNTQAEFNARLIAAAPQLCGALRMILDETNAGTWDCLPVERARAALALVEGEAPPIPERAWPRLRAAVDKLRQSQK